MKHKILLGLTTTPGSNWREKVQEIEKFKIKELALFPTFLKIDERKELYALLEKTGLEKIPHVHLRDDMEEWELDLFFEKYNSRLFNIHPNEADFNFTKNSKYKNIIFVENLFKLDDIYLKILNNCAGLCVDFSHWEDQGMILKHEGYEIMEELIKNHKVGCCHISAISEELNEIVDYQTGYKISGGDNHTMSDFSQLKYVKKYVQYLPEYVSIELENSFEKQLEVKEYLEKIINK